MTDAELPLRQMNVQKPIENRSIDGQSYMIPRKIAAITHPVSLLKRF